MRWLAGYSLVVFVLLLGLTTVAYANEEKTVALPGGATMEFVWIPPGTFTMGTTPTEEQALRGIGMWQDWMTSEQPAHQVVISQGFYLGKYEVAQRQWQAVMGTTPWLDHGVPGDPARPAVCVSWNNAQALVHRLNTQAGDSLYRVPSEAEWEYSCRAGTNTLWSFGDLVSQLPLYGWYYGNTHALGPDLQPVGTKLPNPWGLYDMHGGAWEWCQDWYGAYQSGSVTDPAGPATGTYPTGRSGRYEGGAEYTRSAARVGADFYVPSEERAHIGVRLVMLADPQALNRKAGEVLWSYQTRARGNDENGADSSPAIGDDGTLYFGADDSTLHALSPYGELLWSYAAGGQVDSPALGEDGTIYATSRDGYLHALRPDGAESWRYAHDGLRRSFGQQGSTPVVAADGTVYVGAGDELLAIDATGRLLWRRRVGTGGAEVTPAIDADGTIYMVDGADWEGTRIGYLCATNGDGTEKWRCAVPGMIGWCFSSPAIGSDGTIYVGTGTSKLCAVSRDGRLKWTYQADAFAGELQGGIWSSPTIGPDETIYFCTGVNRDPQYFYAINPDGTLKWRYPVWLGMSSAAVGSDGTIYSSGYAFRPDGTVKWHLDFLSWFSSPTISPNGILYIGSQTGTIYAIDTGISGGLATSAWPKFKQNIRNTGRTMNAALAPTLAVVPDVTVLEGDDVEIRLAGTDPDNDPLTYQVVNAPQGARLSGNAFSWITGYDASGVYAVTFIVSDGNDGRAARSATITVREMDRQPALIVVGSPSGSEGLPMSLLLRGTDPDGDWLTYSVSGNPAGSSLTDSLFTWTPGYNAAGSYRVTFTVSDGLGGQDTETVTLVVAERNGPPSLARLAAQTVREMDPVRLVLSATDPDGEHLTYTVSGNPTGSVLTDSVFAWTPGLYTHGIYRPRFTVTDTRMGTVTATVAITVTARTRYITTSTDTLSFGSVAAGSSKSLSLTISNAGTEVLLVTNVVPGDPQYAVSTGSFSLLGGSARDVTVTFTPVTGRSPLSTLTILSNDPDRPAITVALTASTGSMSNPPVIAVLPSSLTFGSVALGQSKSVTLVVTNDGGSSLRVLNIVSSSGDVTVSKSSFTLAPGAEELLTVTLQPTIAGSLSETLELQSNDPLHPTVQVPLRATVTTGTGRPSLALDTPSLSFGQVAIGETSEFLLPVRNAGTATLTISNAVSDNVQVVASPTSLSIPAQESRSLTVRYRPLPGMPLSGRLTLYSNDTAQPQVGVSWSALEVRSPYLSLPRVTPADGAFGVSTTAEIQLVFSEPLYYRRGFTALDLAVTPEPLSGPVEADLQVRGDGRTVVIPVSLARNTVYRVVVYGATGRSGLELFDMVEASFSTGAAPPVLAKVSGRVTEATGLAVSGSVYLMDSSHRLSAQASVAMDGSFEIAGVGEGSYTLYLDGAIADSRAATGSYDLNGDGVADALTVRAGIDQTGLTMTATVRSGTTPVVSSSLVAVDLDSSASNQGQASLSGVAGDQAVVLEVHATAAEAWTGAAVTVAYDSTKVSFAGVAEGDNLLRQNGGTALFLSHLDPAASTVEYGGAILGATATTAISGSGLLGRFRFTVLDGFSGETALRVTLVKVHTLTGRTDVEPNLTAILRSSGGGSTPATPTGPLTLDFNTADGDQGQTTGSGATVGKTYQVQVHAVGAPTINGWSAKIEYDPVQVRFVSGSFQPSTMVAGLLSLVEEKSSYVSLGGAVLGGSGTGSGSGLLGTATFEVLSGFTGSTDLVIRQMSWKVVGSGEQMQTVEIRGTISAATTGLAGDFNDDGAVNFSDFFLFADAFGGSDPTYDLTADGAVNFSDFFVFADAFGTEARGKLMELAHQYLGLPTKAGLESTWPNPFNAATTIRYRLSAPGLVTLAVYGLTGQRVAILVDEWQEAGSHEVTWDGRAEDGVAAATGAYLIRLAGPGEVQVRKVTLLR